MHRLAARRALTFSVVGNAGVIQWWKMSNSMMMMGIGTPSSQSKIPRPTASSYVDLFEQLTHRACVGSLIGRGTTLSAAAPARAAERFSTSMPSRWGLRRPPAVSRRPMIGEVVVLDFMCPAGPASDSLAGPGRQARFEASSERNALRQRRAASKRSVHSAE